MTDEWTKNQECNIDSKISSLSNLDLSSYETDSYKDILLDKKSGLLESISELESELNSVALSEVMHKVTKKDVKKITSLSLVSDGTVIVKSKWRYTGSSLFFYGIIVIIACYIMSLFRYTADDNGVMSYFMFPVCISGMLSVLLGFIFYSLSENKDEYYYPKQWDVLRKPDLVLEYVSLKRKYDESVELKSILSRLGATEDDVFEADNAIFELSASVASKKTEIDRKTSDKIAFS